MKLEFNAKMTRLGSVSTGVIVPKAIVSNIHTSRVKVTIEELSEVTSEELSEEIEPKKEVGGLENAK